jgi:uncharacterized protein
MDLLLVLTAALAAGAMNAVAGGGSFLTLPALALTGMPALNANATGTLALLPGYLSGAWAFRTETRPPPGLSIVGVLGIGLAGGATGAALLLLTPEGVFRSVVPWLLLMATLLFALAPHIVRLTRHRAGPSKGGQIAIFLVTAYGGYFNGGLGILLLALFGVLGQTNLHAMNGLKNQVSALLTSIAACVYAWGGLIAWREASLMMCASLLGGYLGARVAKVLPAPWIRRGIVATGLAMTALFFLR